jgi:hypothetical protein
MKAKAILLVLLGAALLSFSSAVAQTGPFWVTGDVNGDGVAVTVGDLIALARFVEYGVPYSDSLFKGDLNADCVIDEGDLEVLTCYFQHGPFCLPQFPFTTCGNPDTLRGACCDTLGKCGVRSEGNCNARLGTYHGLNTRCGLSGDLNGDQMINISDVIYTVAYIFSGGPSAHGLIAGDVNCSGTTNISDAVYLVAYIFSNGPAPCGKCAN